MSFDVHTSALRAYATSLHTWSTDSRQATAYVDAHTHLDGSDTVMFSPVLGVNDRVVAALHDALDRIRVVLDASADELTATAARYDATDAAVSAGMDDQYAAVRLPPGQGYSQRGHRPVDTVPEPPQPTPPAPVSSPPTGTTTTAPPTSTPTPAPGPAPTPSPSPGPPPTPPTGTTTTTTVPTPTTTPTAGGR